MKKTFVALAIGIIMISMGSAGIDLFAQDSPDKQIAIKDNNAFALDLYTQLSKEEGNLFFSPNSISTALAMTYAGARGKTATQMANALHFSLSQKQLHQAFFELMKDLKADPRTSGYQLSIANALWGQRDYKFYDEFINITEKYYDAGFKKVDFINEKNREEARQAINKWVEGKTNNKIKELIVKTPQVLTDLTRLVLTNAIYFKGKWQFQFDAKNTQDAPFTLLNGEKVIVPMMSQTKEFNYAENDTLQIIEMAYTGNKLSMVILLPKSIDGLRQIEGSLTQDNLNTWLSTLHNREVIASIPKFKMTSQFELNGALKSLGMVDAFDMQADFSGMAPDPVGLYISEVLHKAFVDVNEEGTEAAAATAVVMMRMGIEEPKPVFMADHPFIFIIRDTKAGSILFMGRVEDPLSNEK